MKTISALCLPLLGAAPIISTIAPDKQDDDDRSRTQQEVEVRLQNDSGFSIGVYWIPISKDDDDFGDQNDNGEEYVEKEEEQVSSSTRKMTTMTTYGQEEQMIMQLESDEEADMAAFWGELFEVRQLPSAETGLCDSSPSSKSGDNKENINQSHTCKIAYLLVYPEEGEESDMTMSLVIREDWEIEQVIEDDADNQEDDNQEDDDDDDQEDDDDDDDQDDEEEEEVEGKQEVPEDPIEYMYTRPKRIGNRRLQFVGYLLPFVAYGIHLLFWILGGTAQIASKKEAVTSSSSSITTTTIVLNDERLPYHVFATMYGASYLLDLIERWEDPVNTTLLLAVYLVLVMTGMPLWGYMTYLVATIVYILVVEFPACGNHVNLFLMFNLAQLSVFFHLVWRRTGNRNKNNKTIPPKDQGNDEANAAGKDKKQGTTVHPRQDNDYHSKNDENKSDDDDHNTKTETKSDSSDPKNKTTVKEEESADHEKRLQEPKGGVSPRLEVQFHRYIRPVVRYSLFFTYFWAGFHKLNYDFLNPESSCTHNFLRRMVKYYPLPKANDYDPNFVLANSVMVIVWEMMGAFTLLFRKTQPYMLLFSLKMHLVLANIHFYDFSSMAIGCFTTFLPLSYWRLWEDESVIVGTRLFSLTRLHVITWVVPTMSAITWCFYDQPGYKSRTVQFTTGMFYTVSLLIMAWPILCRVPNRLPRWDPPMEPVRPRFMWILLAFLGMFGSLNYLGIRTGGTFSMFSNLRTEGGKSNHLLIPHDLFTLVDWQDDLVYIYADPRNHVQNKGQCQGYALPRIEFERNVYNWMKNKDSVPIMVGYEERVYYYQDLVKEAGHFWLPHGYTWKHYFLNFRKVQVITRDEPNECRW